MTTLDRRTFLRGIAYGLLGAVLGWEIEAIAATEAAPAEEEMVVPDTFIDDAYIEGIAALDHADGLDAVRWAGAPLPDIYVGVGDDGRALVSVNGKEPYWCNSLNDPLHQLYHDFAVENARIIDREVMSFIMSLQGDKE